jgi:putative peptide zinc metalloprotease protein
MSNTQTVGTSQAQTPNLSVVFAAIRPDLIFQRQRFKNEEYFVIKDPLSLSYFRITPRETFLMHLLNGKRNLGQIVETYNEEFPNQPRTAQEVLDFCNQLGRQGLLVINARSFVEISKFKPKPTYSIFKLWVQAISKIMFFKFPLLDPSPWLGKFVNSIRFVWSTFFVCGCVLFYAYSALMVYLNREEFIDFVSHKISFFSPANLAMLPLAWILIKTCHEFGHATTCRRFGGEVHEMGACLICFMPCGYVDASDAWMMKNKNHKIYITAAGIFVELMIASIMAHVWLNTHDGVMRNFCFDAMMIASVYTIFFNMNPLMKFDGYYVVADWLEIPNLRTKAFMYCSYHLQRILLGYRNTQQEASLDTEDPGKIFIIYAIAAYVYMAKVIYSLSQLFSRFLEKYELRDFGLLLGIAAQVSFLLFPFWRVFYDAFKPGAHIVSIESVGRRSAKWGSILIVGFGILFVWPVHFKIESQGIFSALKAEIITSAIPGVLTELHVRTGDPVHEGEIVGNLSNQDVLLREDQALVAVEMGELGVQYQRSLPHEQVAQAILELDIAQVQLASAKEDLQELNLVSKINGVVLTPDVERLVGKYFPAELSILRVGDPDAMELVIPVSEAEIGLLEIGSVVKARVLGTGDFVRAIVMSIVPRKAGANEYAWSMYEEFGGEVTLYHRMQGVKAPSFYFVHAELEGDQPVGIHEMMRVQATIFGRKTTIAGKYWREFINWWNLRGPTKNPFSQF